MIDTAAAYLSAQSAYNQQLSQSAANQQKFEAQSKTIALQTQMYGQMAYLNAMQNAFKRPPLFPRSDDTKVYRMNRFVEWKRQKIAERHWRHLGMLLVWTCLPALCLVVVTLCWRLAMYVVLL